MSFVATALRILFSQYWSDCYRNRAKLAGVRQNTHGTLKRMEGCSRTKTGADIFIFRKRDAGSCFVAAEGDGEGRAANYS